MKRYKVFRSAVLMEDEGREEFIKSFDSIQEARDWIASQEGQYFKPGDYYIATVTV